MIIRVEHQANYTVTRNKTVRDSRLSFKATGLLVYLLSLSNEATTNAKQLSKIKKEGEKAILTGLRELEAAGYLTRERQQIERGRWVTVVTIRERSNTDPPSPKAGYGVPVHGVPVNRSSSTKYQGKETRPVQRGPGPEKCKICSKTATEVNDLGQWFCIDHIIDYYNQRDGYSDAS